MPSIEELSYQDYLRIFRRRWKFAAMLAAAGAVGGLVLARLQAPIPVYASLAAVSFDATRGFEVSPGFVVPSQGIDQSGQILMIRSTQVMGNAARRLGLIPADTPREKFSEFQSAIDQLIFSVFVSQDPTRPTAPIIISAALPDPNRAADTANAVAEAYKEENLYELKKFIIKRREFLDHQLKENEENLNRAQLAYEEYRRQHPLAEFEPGKNIAEEQQKAQELAGQIQEARRQLDLVNAGRPVSDLGLIAIVGARNTARLTQLSTQYTNLQLQRSQLLGDLTEQHPLIKAKQKEIEEVRRALADELELILDAFQKQQEQTQKDAEALHELQKTLPAEAQQLAHLSHEVKVYEMLGMNLGGQLVDTMAKESGISGQVQIVSPARASNLPVNPPAYGRLGLIGAGGGMFLGLVLGVFLETSRFSLRSLRDLETSLGVPMLGVNPTVAPNAVAQWLRARRAPSPGTADWSRVLGLANLLAPRSSMSEAIRALRAALQGALDSGQSAFTICATVPGEGATTTALNLALSFAQAGRRVLLVESDLRSPAISRILGLDREPGFTDLLQQTTDLEHATRNVADFVTGALTVDQVLLAPGVDQLHVVPCGKKTGSAVELFASGAFSAALAAMRSRYDVILFDGTALSTAAYSMLLAKQTAVVVVFCPTKSDPRRFEDAVVQLRKSDCNVIGFFVNAMETDPGAETETVALAESA